MKRLFAFPLRKNEYRIIDGDTIEVMLDKGDNDYKLTKVRLNGLDSPESRTRRKLEKQAGLLVKQVVSVWLEKRKVDKCFYASSDEKPKYAHRRVGRIWADDESDCLNEYLLKLEIVKEYHGGTKEKYTDEELKVIIEKCKAELSLVVGD